MTSYTFPTVSKALPVLLSNLLESGDEVGSRNGRVKEFLNTQIVIKDPVCREVLSIGRKANIFAQIAETMWVLSGRNDIEWLSAYLPRAGDYSDDGQTWRAGYGPRIRSWWDRPAGSRVAVDKPIDQLAYVIDTLRADPLSRQAVIALWDPAVDTTPGKDKACNTFLQFQSRLGALHLMVNVRSNDVMWGWSGINAFEWSTLQEMVASILGINVGDLTFNIGSLHLYEPHWEKARHVEYGYEDFQYETIPFDPLHTVRDLEQLDELIGVWFTWEEVCRQGGATHELWVNFPAEPLLKRWAAAIAYYWTQDPAWLETFEGTALAVAVARTPASLLPAAPQTSHSVPVGLGHNLAAHERTRAFYEFVKDLHATKHASYGDSWKKRGEKMSILANMARKVDRLGVGDEYDSSADTLIDLMVYAVKYECWLAGIDDGPENVNFRLSYYLGEMEEVNAPWPLDLTLTGIVNDFNGYADSVDEFDVEEKDAFLTGLLVNLVPVARDVWYAEQDKDEYQGADHE